ncbi:hypothetical protein PanWU01x14_017970 [Parasponia andersonii]|uniref:Uncharacterized protein n=1 Tax=Parasponia andersonii TaxID=3476 RepID=A0A2P5DZ17_PARAD|nr:hypothetical protein PanWU01x14_017970 [Parasponia andersonii]
MKMKMKMKMKTDVSVGLMLLILSGLAPYGFKDLDGLLLCLISPGHLITIILLLGPAEVEDNQTSYRKAQKFGEQASAIFGPVL